VFLFLVYIENNVGHNWPALGIPEHTLDCLHNGCYFTDCIQAWDVNTAAQLIMRINNHATLEFIGKAEDKLGDFINIPKQTSHLHVSNLSIYWTMKFCNSFSMTLYLPSASRHYRQHIEQQIRFRWMISLTVGQDGCTEASVVFLSLSKHIPGSRQLKTYALITISKAVM
jgi:hypothetical protein